MMRKFHFKNRFSTSKLYNLTLETQHTQTTHASHFGHLQSPKAVWSWLTVKGIEKEFLCGLLLQPD